MTLNWSFILVCIVGMTFSNSQNQNLNSSQQEEQVDFDNKGKC